MEKSQIYDILPIFAMFAWMMIMPILVPRDFMLRHVLNTVGMVFSIMSMVVVNEALKWKAAEFTHIKATCRPSNIQLDIFFKELETIEIEPGTCATKLSLAEKMIHPFYGVLDQYIIIKHELKWEDRMTFEAGKAIFKGQIIDHAQSAKVVLYEPHNVFDMDHLNPVPVFWLREAPNDSQYPQQMSILAQIAGDQEYSAELFNYSEVYKEMEMLKGRNIELKRQALRHHQDKIRLEEVNDQLKNELHAVLGSKSDQKQCVVEQVLTALEAHTNIRTALQSLQPTSWLTRGFIMLFLGLAVVGLFLVNPGEIMGWLSIKQNQFFIIILAGVVAGIYYYTRRKR